MADIGTQADIYDILAGKGRGEDEYIRNVSGRPSHVNEVEKDAIDIYGILGERFTQKVGTGDINPNTNLPEYNWKKKYVIGSGWKRKSKSGSPHNEGHDDWFGSGGSKGDKSQGTKGMSWQHTYPDQRREEIRAEQATRKGQDLLADEETIGEMDDFGQETLTASDYQGMTPKEIAKDIFAKKYNNTRPEGYDSDEAFLIEIAGRLDKMPQFKGVAEEEIGFAEKKREQDIYKLRGEASKVTAEGSKVLGTGMGGGMRTQIAGQAAISEGFDVAQTGFDASVYGLEQEAEASWETDFSSFVGALPDAT